MNNVGTIDRIIRALVGTILLLLIFIGPETLWGLIGVIPLTTAIIGYCPAYAVFGINYTDKHSRSHNN